MDYQKIAIDTIVEKATGYFGVKATVSDVGEINSPVKVDDFTVILGIAGQVSGQVMFGFKEEMVTKLASKMIDQEMTELDELTMSAVAEFTNVMTGNITIELVEAGSDKLGMSPPSIIMGKNMRISTKIKPIIQYRLNFEDYGYITVNVALGEKKVNGGD